MSASFPVTSRYAGVATAELERPDGRVIVYLRRRFVPPGSSLELLEWHTLAEGERLDHVAARHFDDPEQFWRICDANDALHPRELLRPVGRKLRITLPAGIAGVAR